MSHPNPHHDRDNEYAQDSKGPVASKKKAMAKKMSDKPNMNVIMNGKKANKSSFQGRTKQSDRKEMESTYQHMQGF